MKDHNYNAVAASRMQEVYVQVKELSDELVLLRKWPCFRQRKAETDKDGKETVAGRPCCVMYYPRDMREEMCPTCQLLAAVQDVERTLHQAIRVQQMIEAGRLDAGA